MSDRYGIKWHKKLGALFLCLLLCAGMCTPVFADNENNAQGITFYGNLDRSTVTASGEDQTVTLHIFASKEISVGTVQFVVTIPDPLTLVSVTGGGTSGEAGKQNENADDAHWIIENADGETLTEIAAITYLVPGGTAAGTYAVGITELELMDENYIQIENSATVTQTLIVQNLSVEGYTAGLSVLSDEISAGETVSVNVAVNHSSETSFAAAEIAVEYDPAAFSFCQQASALGTASVRDVAGTLTLEDYGQNKNFGNSVYVLAFEALSAGTGTVTLQSAAFINKEGAAKNDLAPAEIRSRTVTLQISKRNYPVTLDEIFTGPANAVEGETYYFAQATDGVHYDYGKVAATVDGNATDVQEYDDGAYSISDVAGPVVISGSRTPKRYSVTLTGNAAAEIADAPDTAVYHTDYSFTLPSIEGWIYCVESIVIGDAECTTYTAENGTYTIPGTEICGDVVISVSKEATQTGVTVEGNGAGAAAGYNPVAELGQDYTLTIAPEKGYSYTVSATMAGEPVPVTDLGDNTYTVENVSGALVFTVSRTLMVEGVSVSRYLNLDGTALWLIKNNVELEDGRIPTYEGESMFWSDQYQTYCFLAVTQTLSQEEAAARVDVTDGTAVAVDYGMDVNKSGRADASDAQLTYNMYNAQYSGITAEVTVEKYLRADVNGDSEINVNDSVAIVNGLLA